MSETITTEMFPWVIQVETKDGEDYSPAITIGPEGGKLFIQVGKIELKIEQHPETGVVEVDAYDKQTCSQDLGQMLLFQRDVEE